MKAKLDEFIKAAEALKKSCDDAEIGFATVSEDMLQKSLQLKKDVAKIFFDASREAGLENSKAKELAEKAHKILEEQKVELKDQILEHIKQMEERIKGKKDEIPKMIARAKKMLDNDMPEEAINKANAAMVMVNALLDPRQKEDYKDDIDIIINKANKRIAQKARGESADETDEAEAKGDAEKKEGDDAPATKTIEEWFNEHYRDIASISAPDRSVVDGLLRPLKQDIDEIVSKAADKAGIKRRMIELIDEKISSVSGSVGRFDKNSKSYKDLIAYNRRVISEQDKLLLLIDRLQEIKQYVQNLS